MKKYLGLVALLMGLSGLAFAGTPQETFYQGQAPLSGTTILASSVSATSNGTFTLTVGSPTVINSGGGTYTGRNCFTNIGVQVSSTTSFTITDAGVVKYQINGLSLTSTGSFLHQITREHLGPLCMSANQQTVFILANTAGNAALPTSINVEGYTTYGGTNNAGPMQ